MNILITGAKGFIGKNLIATLHNIADGKDRSFDMDTDLTVFEYDIDTDVALLARDLKRSIQEPDGDFVKILPLSMASDTILMTSDEMEQLQGARKYESAYDALYDDDYSQKRAKENNSNADLDPKMTKVMKTLIIAAIVVFVGALGVGSFLLVKWFNNSSGNVTQSKEDNLVPDLKGKTVEEAEKLCEEVGLELVVKDATKLHLEMLPVCKYNPCHNPNVI